MCTRLASLLAGPLAALEQWHLHRRIALLIMRAIGTSPQRLLLGMLVATASVSLWISNTATAVMMVPIGMALISQLESGERRRLHHFGAALMRAVAYGANVGGIGTKPMFDSEQTLWTPVLPPVPWKLVEQESGSVRG